MTFPSDSHMLVLVAIIIGEQLLPAPDGDSLTLTVENGTVPADLAALDHLESVGWCEVWEGGVRATDHGRRGAERWMTKVCGLRGKDRVALTDRTRVAGEVIPRRVA